MTLATVAESAGSSEKLLIYTLIGGHVVTLVTLAIKALIDQANRVQDRLDAESKARMLLAEGARREQRINAKIDENTAVNVEAIRVANGHNEKIAELTQTVARAAEGGK
jgi:transaldolase